MKPRDKKRRAREIIHEKAVFTLFPFDHVFYANFAFDRIRIAKQKLLRWACKKSSMNQSIFLKLHVLIIVWFKLSNVKSS